jgi:hypothetical protein
VKEKYIKKVFAEHTEERTDHVKRLGQLKNEKNYSEAEEPVEFRCM